MTAILNALFAWFFTDSVVDQLLAYILSLFTGTGATP